MNVRLLPVLLTFVIASGLLFGGYFFYQAYAVDHPIKEGIAATSGVADAEVETTRSRITVRLRLEEAARLYDVYRAVAEQVAERAGGRETVIDLSAGSSSELEAIWHTALFDLAEAMENRCYGDVPRLMDDLAKRHPGLAVETAMDKSRIYVTLRLEGAAFHRVLPLEGERLGGWASE